METLDLDDTVAKIKSLEIQGAERIARAAVKAWASKLEQGADHAALETAAQKLIAARATEPGLRNALKFCLSNYQDNPNVTEEVLKYFQESKEKISEYGANKIHDGMIVITHCHSSTSEGCIIKAWEQGKRFTVYNTETRPRYQGRITAEAIASHGIPVEHFVDSGARLAMKEADLFLFGCDSLSAEGKVINKIGTPQMLEFAQKYDVPSYTCTNSWKLNPETVFGVEEEIEERDPAEVWPDAPKGVKIHNPAFEVSDPDDITGVICELGIYKPEALITEVKNAYPWMF